MREGTGPKSQRKEYNGVLLEMLISKEGKMSVSFSCRPSSSPGELLALPFYTLRGALEEKAERALSVLLWRRAPVHAGHPWGVVVMLTTGRRDIWGAAEDV
jgi:hypothetical protein